MRVYTIQPPAIVRQLHTQDIVYSLYHKALAQKRHWESFKRPYQFIYDSYTQQKEYQFGRDQGLFWAYDRFSYFDHGDYRLMANKRASRYLLSVELPDDFGLAFLSSAWDICLNQGNLLESNWHQPEGYDWPLMFAPDAVAVMAADFRRHNPDEATDGDEQIVGTTRQVVFPYIREEWVQAEKHFRGKAIRISI
jgi:hypothetical protein